MKRIIMAALMLVVALSFSVALSQSKKAMGNKAGLEKTVPAFFEFVKANDVAKIKSYYTADYTFTGPEGKIMGAEERLKVLQRSEEHTSELQSPCNLVCRLLLEKK